MRIAICGNDKIFCQILIKLLNEYSRHKPIEFEIVSFSSGEDLLYYREALPIVLMDIELSGAMNGITATELLHQKSPDTIVILISNHVKYFKDGFRVQAFRFMTKPIHLSEFTEYINDAVTDILGNRKISLRKNGVDIAINLKNVLYIAAQHGYTEIWTATNSYRSENSLLMWEDILDPRLFFRCHKKYLVNISQIKDLSKSVRLKSGDIVEVSRRKYPELRELFMNYNVSHSF